jgi:hypothetical protein
VRLYAINCKAAAEKIARAGSRSRKLGGLGDSADIIYDKEPYLLPVEHIEATLRRAVDAASATRRSDQERNLSITSSFSSLVRDLQTP